jgi:hypothetical protein
VKFGTDLQKMPLTDEFHGTVTAMLIEGVNEIVPYFLCFAYILDKI